MLCSAAIKAHYSERALQTKPSEIQRFYLGLFLALAKLQSIWRVFCLPTEPRFLFSVAIFMLSEVLLHFYISINPNAS